MYCIQVEDRSFINIGASKSEGLKTIMYCNTSGRSKLNRWGGGGGGRYEGGGAI